MYACIYEHASKGNRLFFTAIAFDRDQPHPSTHTLLLRRVVGLMLAEADLERAYRAAARGVASKPKRRYAFFI